MPTLKHATIAVFSKKQDLAESLVSHMRKSGLSVQGQWINNIDNIEQQWEKELPDALVISADSDISLETIQPARDTLARHASIILINTKLDIAASTQALHQGVQAVVIENDLEYLAAIVHRELGVSQNLLARTLAEEQLISLAKRHRNLIEETSEAVAYLQEGILLRSNRQFASVFGFESPDALESLPLMDLIAKPDQNKVRDLVKACEKSDPESVNEPSKPIAFNGKSQDGVNLPLSLRLRRIRSNSKIPQIEIIIPHEAPPAAFVPKAGLGGGIHSGRHSLYTALNSLGEHGTGSGIAALLFLAIDSAAGMEERLGFLASDQISDEVAAFILDRVSDSDRVFRFDNHEFAVLLFRKNVQAAAAAAEDLREAINNRSYGEGDKATSLSVSGIVKPLGKFKELDDLLFDMRRDTQRLQASQGTGFALEENQQDPATSGDDQQWLNRVQQALEKNSFRLVYLPIASLEGGKDEFLDVYLRMLDDKGEEIMAGSFMPVAERHGLTPMIDQWVIKRASAAARKRQKEGRPCVMLVRLSTSTVAASETLLPWLKDFLALHKNEPPQLTFTIKEQALTDRYAKASHFIHQLRDMGCRVAVSNFGGSPRSLQLIKDVDLDFVKLQASFTQALTQGDIDGKVKKIIDLVSSRNAKIVAEHVEDATAMAQLWQMGIHYIQGSSVQVD